jgi:hypothetical protein
MPVFRGPNQKSIPLNVAGSSVYGIYPKISNERTYNFFVSDGFLVPYPGYKIGLSSSLFGSAQSGRCLYASVKSNLIYAVFDDRFFQISLTYEHQQQKITYYQIAELGRLKTTKGPVFIAENNAPQILLSDGQSLYLYDPTKISSAVSITVDSGGSPPANKVVTFSSPINLDAGDPVTFTNSGGALPSPLVSGQTYYVSATGLTSTTIELALNPTDAYLGTPTITFTTNGSGTNSINTLGSFQIPKINFTPGYISFHDTYFLCAASSDSYYSPVANNTWRLSAQNNGNLWPDTSQTIGLLETKPDNTQAVVRFPSKGNMILVMGETVTEFWFDTGNQLFPYQRTNQGSIDYGCINPATVASMDEIVVWLAHNEKSGPIIMYSTGGEPQKVTTDGIDFELSEIDNPENSQGFLYRKNGHLFYHLNFYQDNLSFVVDFNTNKIYNACDQDLNHYSMGQVVWYNNQYFSISKDNGNFFIFDTVFPTYQTVDLSGNPVEYEIPRIRTTKNIRLPSQDYFIINDVGFTIESGDTNYQVQTQGSLYLATVSGQPLVTTGNTLFLVTMDGNFLTTMAGDFLIGTQTDENRENLICVQQDIRQSTPRVDLSVSYDGGATFSSDFPYVLPPIGKRRNRLMWWQGGVCNDAVFQFKFWGIGRVTATDGVVNIRQ